jgi:hypothetical protein
LGFSPKDCGYGTIAAVSNIASVPKKGKCKVILRWDGLPFSNFVHLPFRKYNKMIEIGKYNNNFA